MIWRIDVFPKSHAPSTALAQQIADLGVTGSFQVYLRPVYLIDADINDSDMRSIADALLIDPVIENYRVSRGFFETVPSESEILVTYNPGVSDPVALSLEKAIKDLCFSVKNTRIARAYSFKGLERPVINSVAPKLFFNPLIEHIVEYGKVKDLDSLDEFKGKRYDFSLTHVEMLSVGDTRLKEISGQGCLSLSLQEMRIIKDYFKRKQRNPTDCELETIATLWSEHCAHKTFRGRIVYEERDLRGRPKQITIDNLLKATVMKATKRIGSKHCVSVFHDNSGVVRFDKNNNICFKVETHNHPSSLEPYGGASTGIGGVIRDILGTGCSAKPFANIDVFCFAPWRISYEDLPQGLLHPKRIIKGVTRGVRDYGNRMGIPTVAGAVLFDDRYLGNPLVYCGTLGIIPKEKSFKKVEAGDLVMLCGAKTGRDGIHGATFSSKELDEQTVGLTSAVQIGNAIEEKKVTEAILRARDKDLFAAITDCGAGGLSSAVTELAQEHGVEVHLDKVPLKYSGLSYTEIWISESQERMVFFAKERDLAQLKELFDEEDVDLTVIGKVTDSKKLVLYYQGNTVCELDLDFIFELPTLEKQAQWILKKETPIALREEKNYNTQVLNLLASPNIACKDWVLREYDHEVQAGSVQKSIFGITQTAASDAAIVRPDLHSNKSVAIAVGINPFYSDHDPYWMAALAIDEALRNVVCAGADLSRTFILDNFCWGSPQDKTLLGGLVRAAFAARDFATYFKVPFISGKDSFYNEYTVGKKRIAVPGTLLISAMSVIDDWKKSLNATFKKEGNLIYLIGATKNELGCSEYFRSLGVKAGLVPRVDKRTAKKTLDRVSSVINKGHVSSCHDLSEGGLAVAAAEMCINSGLGADIFLEEVAAKESLRAYEKLFSESATRFLVEVEKKRQRKFERQLKGIAWGLVGCVSAESKLTFYDKGAKIVDLDIEALERAWLSTFKEFR